MKGGIDSLVGVLDLTSFLLLALSLSGLSSLGVYISMSRLVYYAILVPPVGRILSKSKDERIDRWSEKGWKRSAVKG